MSNFTKGDRVTYDAKDEYATREDGITGTVVKADAYFPNVTVQWDDGEVMGHDDGYLRLSEKVTYTVGDVITETLSDDDFKALPVGFEAADCDGDMVHITKPGTWSRRDGSDYPYTYNPFDDYLPYTVVKSGAAVEETPAVAVPVDVLTRLVTQGSYDGYSHTLGADLEVVRALLPKEEPKQVTVVFTVPDDEDIERILDEALEPYDVAWEVQE